MRRYERQKVFDAHIHVGYFPRKDGRGGEAYYWSPARLLQHLRWTGAEEFIFSSTNACWDSHAEAMHPEAEEVLRLAGLNGMKAHPFFWCSMEYLEWDSNLARLPSFYDGIKLHGVESHWNEHPRLLRRVLSIADERRLPVQIHTGNDDLNGCKTYLPFCRKFPDIRFDLAHGHPVKEAVEALKECQNVWVDVSFSTKDEMEELYTSAPDRVMYGSDFPAQKQHWDISLTDYMRKKIKEAYTIGGDAMLFRNAMGFIGGRVTP